LRMIGLKKATLGVFRKIASKTPIVTNDLPEYGSAEEMNIERIML